MKKRIAIIATCGGLLVLTATFAHSESIFDRWGNLRTETPGKNAKTHQTLPQNGARQNAVPCCVAAGDVNGDGRAGRRNSTSDHASGGNKK